jgi:acetyl esterase/lipase
MYFIKAFMQKLLISVIGVGLVFFFGGQMKKTNTSYIKNKYLDTPYASISKSQKLDIYLPDTAYKPLPVIVAIHGGAFMSGDKRDGQLNPMLEGIKRGYAIISVNYRLSKEAKFPAQIQDIKAAIRWIKANAKKYNLNPDKIGAWGGSAGGHLASLLGTSGNIKELEDLNLGSPGFTSNVHAVVDWFGPIDFLKMDEQFMKSGKGKADHSKSDSPESRLMGKRISDIPDAVEKANPETYISADDPPFFIEHGTNDKLIPTLQSENLYQKLISVLGEQKVTLKLIEGAGHGGPEFLTKKNIDLVFKFLDKYLKE